MQSGTVIWNLYFRREKKKKIWNNPICWWGCVCCCIVLLTLCVHYFTSPPWPQQNCPLWDNYSFFNWIELNICSMLTTRRWLTRLCWFKTSSAATRHRSARRIQGAARKALDGNWSGWKRGATSLSSFSRDSGQGPQLVRQLLDILLLTAFI